MPVLHPKFLQCFGICTHPCNLGTHTGGLTPFHPPLDTTTLAIVVDGMQRVCHILRHGEEIFQNLILCLFVLPRNLLRPTKGTKSEVKTYAGGHHDAPSISKYGSLAQPAAQIAALC